MSTIQQAVSLFLYSPIGTKLTLPCFCGGTLKSKGYGCGEGNGSGELQCENGHGMILAHQFCSINSFPRHSDEVRITVKRHEDQICSYCNEKVGNKQFQWHPRAGCCHSDCHDNKVLQVIIEARKDKKTLKEIAEILSDKGLEWGTQSHVYGIYSDYINSKLTAIQSQESVKQEHEK